MQRFFVQARLNVLGQDGDKKDKKGVMSIGLKVGHSYFGVGTIVGLTESVLTVDFGYPFGVRVVAYQSVSPAA